MDSAFAREDLTRCPGCGRVLDTSALQPGERFKCAKCKKLLTCGRHLASPQYAASWQATRTGLLLVLVATTVWCVTVGYDFGARTGQWALGFGGPLLLWFIVIGCVVLASRTTQNPVVLVGVVAGMNGLALFFVERVGRHVGYDVGRWHERFRGFRLWAPALIVLGVVVLAAGLLVQARRRSV